MPAYPSSPLSDLLNEINAAAENKLALVALAMVTALPDICVSLSSEDGRTDGARFKEWCRENLGPVFQELTPDDLYSMRCGVLHNGRFGDLQHGFSRAIFLLPWNGNVFSGSMGDAFFYSAVEFVRAFTDAVHSWFEANKDTAIVQANLDRFMQYRPEGYGNLIKGLAVIA